ncbi:hypothetical protein F1D05_23015 [Kribbella qitaiheensis]|uniref:Uncharacterized protein n=1 Tax=Kribbella qitaiheensis TaxID=1544730 RepID=A0A7G6X1Z3_9ACTN|nr:hypothetical protein [Kribbella qitaiheensis]QNE20258.1 hypothetical protein F1D05_23015 [Kribbella qitaiheensis]
MKDEDLGLLLRETFAEKEELIDNLPEATIIARRRTGPILLAAASVLVILGGILYAVQWTGHDTPIGQATTTGPAATTAPGSIPTMTPPPGSTATDGQPVPERSMIWAAAIAEILKIERPAAGWPGIRVLDAPNGGAGGNGITYELATPFTAAERAGIEKALAAVAPVHWVRSRPTGGANVCDQPAAKEPYVTVGPIVPTQGHVEVGINVWRGCLDARWMTYRLDQKAGTWTVMGTIGPVAVS